MIRALAADLAVMPLARVASVFVGRKVGRPMQAIARRASEMGWVENILQVAARLTAAVMALAARQRPGPGGDSLL